MDLIPHKLIPHIEKAIGIELYDHQKEYLTTYKGVLKPGRATGKTIAYCIKLALSNGEPLDLRKPYKFSDYDLGITNHTAYSRNFFVHEFMNIRGLLKLYGFKVRDVK